MMANTMKRTLAIILAGGVGTRLAPLTHHRAKPAVHFGGKYRIIDFTLSNCLHSDIRHIFVLTQYRSHSMLKHLRDGWGVLTPELGEYITAIPAQMKDGNHWYQGTADAVYQNIDLLRWSNCKYIVVLSGDHIYRMDYASMLCHHIEHDADATIACMTIPRNQASEFGVIEVDATMRITGFTEKPEQPSALSDAPDQSLISMGIYIFNKKKLIQMLEEDRQQPHSRHDFGHDIIPAWIEKGKVNAYPFGGISGRVSSDKYWRDVGTLDSFFDANMDLLKAVPPLNLYQADWPIRTYNPQQPPCRTGPSPSGKCERLNNVIINGGSSVIGASVKHSILGRQVYIEPEADIEDSIFFGQVSIGKGAILRRCIVDKHVHIPEGETIGVDREKDSRHFKVTDSGITVVPVGYRFKRK